MLTARGRRTLAVAAAAAVCGRIFAIPELFGLAAAALVLVGAALGRVWLARGGASLEARAVPGIVSAGEPSLLEITVEESGVTGPPSASLTLEPDGPAVAGGEHPDRVTVPRLSPGSQAHVAFPLPTERRGVVESSGYEAFIGDVLGLARRPIARSRPARCVVLPHVEPLSTVVPRGLGWVGTESTRSAAERLLSGISLLRPYSPGDDARRVHWRTTARVGELMIREGGDRDDPDQIATTVVLDPGGSATSAQEVERAVEVAASVLATAAEETTAATTGEFRLVTTTGIDTGAKRGPEALRSALVALASVAPSLTGGPVRFESMLERLAHPERREVLVVVVTSDGPIDTRRLGTLASEYVVAILVVVGATGAEEAHFVDAQGEAVAGSHVIVVPLRVDATLESAWNPGYDGLSWEVAG